MINELRLTLADIERELTEGNMKYELQVLTDLEKKRLKELHVMIPQVKKIGGIKAINHITVRPSEGGRKNGSIRIDMNGSYPKELAKIASGKKWVKVSEIDASKKDGKVCRIEFFTLHLDEGLKQVIKKSRLDKKTSYEY